jgi:hypothetical protein
MCNACGFPARTGHWTDARLDTPHDRLRARVRRAQVLARVLRPYGMAAHDDGVTDGLILSTLSGASVIVTDPAELWPTVKRLAGRGFDPLVARSTIACL